MGVEVFLTYSIVQTFLRQTGFIIFPAGTTGGWAAMHSAGLGRQAGESANFLPTIDRLNAPVVQPGQQGWGM